LYLPTLAFRRKFLSLGESVNERTDQSSLQTRKNDAHEMQAQDIVAHGRGRQFVLCVVEEFKGSRADTAERACSDSTGEKVGARNTSTPSELATHY
jgi:hypothetical protein